MLLVAYSHYSPSPTIRVCLMLPHHRLVTGYHGITIATVYVGIATNVMVNDSAKAKLFGIVKA